MCWFTNTFSLYYYQKETLPVAVDDYQQPANKAWSKLMVGSGTSDDGFLMEKYRFR
jgi:hypothetical protein